MKLVIQRYTREAGVRNLERNLAALARAAAVKVAEQEHLVPFSKDVQRLSSPLLDGKLAESAEVEMEVIPMGVNNHDISDAFKVASPMVVDEPMVEKVLGVSIFSIPSVIVRVIISVLFVKNLTLIEEMVYHLFIWSWTIFKS